MGRGGVKDRDEFTNNVMQTQIYYTLTLSRETQQKAVEDEKQDMQKTHTLIESVIAEQQRDNHSEETERERVWVKVR